MNKERCIAIGGLTLCTTLLATGFNAPASLINAFLMVGIAVFSELKLESDDAVGQTIQNKVNVALVL